MDYGVGVNCIFRQDEDYCAGRNWELIFERFEALGVRWVEITALRRFLPADEIYLAQLEFLARKQEDGLRIALHHGNHGLSDPSEAFRCYSCGSCTHCDNCLVYCPEGIIHRAENGPGYVIDLDYCKGCGICVAECPRSSMEMIEG